MTSASTSIDAQQSIESEPTMLEQYREDKVFLQNAIDHIAMADLAMPDDIEDLCYGVNPEDLELLLHNCKCIL
jgi:hypothetical protein